MKEWFYKELAEEAGAFPISRQIHDSFRSLARSNGISRHVAVFSSYDIKNKVVSVYFSPSAAILAAAFGATPCTKPAPQRTFELLAGCSQSWDIHFPEHEPAIF